MAALIDSERFTAWAELMRRGETYGTLLKPDLRAAVDAVDSWVNANTASFNAALPEPAKTQLDARQKALLLMAVVQRRFGVA